MTVPEMPLGSVKDPRAESPAQGRVFSHMALDLERQSCQPRLLVRERICRTALQHGYIAFGTGRGAADQKDGPLVLCEVT